MHCQKPAKHMLKAYQICFFSKKNNIISMTSLGHDKKPKN